MTHYKIDGYRFDVEGLPGIVRVFVPKFVPEIYLQRADDFEMLWRAYDGLYSASIVLDSFDDKIEEVKNKMFDKCFSHLNIHGFDINFLEVQFTLENGAVVAFMPGVTCEIREENGRIYRFYLSSHLVDSYIEFMYILKWYGVEI